LKNSGLLIDKYNNIDEASIPRLLRVVDPISNLTKSIIKSTLENAAKKIAKNSMNFANLVESDIRSSFTPNDSNMGRGFFATLP
jgi:3-methyladenine DNA glycosylase AlkD